MATQGVVNGPSTDSAIAPLIRSLRTYLRDNPATNKLLDTEESDDRFLAWALLDALDDINNSPPPLRYGLANFPYPSLLIRGAAITVLESVGILQTRNQLNYHDNGVPTGVSEKTPLYQAWLNMLRSQYEQNKMRWKISQNICQAYGQGGLHSEYWALSGMYGL